MAPAPSPPPRRKGESLGPESFYFSSSSTGQNLSLPVGSPPPSSSRQPWGFLWAQESQCGPQPALSGPRPVLLSAHVALVTLSYSTLCSSETKFPIFVSTRLLPLPLSLFTLSYFVTPTNSSGVEGLLKKSNKEARVTSSSDEPCSRGDSRVR